MKTRSAVLALTLALLASGQGFAQPKIVVLSSQAIVGSTLPRDCQKQAEVVGQALDMAPHAPDWTYIVACDDQAWRSVLVYGAAPRIQVPSSGYTVIRLRLFQDDDSLPQRRHLGWGPVARLVGKAVLRGIISRSRRR
jgi:hypothetical protein